MMTSYEHQQAPRGPRRTNYHKLLAASRPAFPSDNAAALLPTPATEQTPLLSKGKDVVKSADLNKVSGGPGGRGDRQENSRPALLHAVTTTATTSSSSRIEATTPQFSRPIITRSATTTINAGTLQSGTNSFLRAPSSKTARPGLLKRVTNSFTQLLDPNEGTSHNARNTPPRPTHWSTHVYQAKLLETWDDVHDQALGKGTKKPVALLTQLVRTKVRMLQMFPELGAGEEVLSRDWIEYVLGVNMKHPFCVRWEPLAAVATVGGVRGGWGPW